MTISKWLFTPLGGAIRQRKELIKIDDARRYKRCRVQLHARGILLRDTVHGTEIKTKSQQVCQHGEFLVAEIDAKVGGFGIVPEELDGAIVSSHYFLFTIDENKLDRRFLDYFIRTDAFLEQVTAQGSTNYAAIRPKDVMDYCIPLPPLFEQKRIVKRIDMVAANVKEAECLKVELREERGAVPAALNDYLAKGDESRLSSFLQLKEEREVVRPENVYPQAGLRGFGGGLFAKDAICGIDTAYKSFNRLYKGAVVLSQVKGWEGAIDIVGAEFDGLFVSPEYRTFSCVKGKAIPEYLAHLFKSPWFLNRLKGLTRGMGGRRERTRPEQFLELVIPFPSLQDQQKAITALRGFMEVDSINETTIPDLHALLPSILDKAFKGEL